MEKFLDYETERLYRIIDNKKKYLATLQTDKMQYKHLLSEIEFLEGEILPVILHRNLYLNDINKFVDQSIVKSAKSGLANKAVGMLIYIQLRDPLKELEPIIFISNKENMIIEPNMKVGSEYGFTTLIPEKI